MSNAHRVVQSLASGLLLALMAPAFAALAFLLLAAASNPSAVHEFDSSIDGMALLILGFASGSYLVGAIPAFLAGLALPSLVKVLPAVFASAASGVLGVLAYLLTFGSHLLSDQGLRGSLGLYALPAFLGVAAAAFIAQRIERQHEA